MVVARQDHDWLDYEKKVAAVKPVKQKLSKSLQTKAFELANSPTKALDATANTKRSPNHVRQTTGKKLPGGIRKARVSVSSQKAGKGWPEKTLTSRFEGGKSL